MNPYDNTNFFHLILRQSYLRQGVVLDKFYRNNY